MSDNNEEQQLSEETSSERPERNEGKRGVADDGRFALQKQAPFKPEESEPTGEIISPERHNEALRRTSLSEQQIASLSDIPLRIIRRAWFTLSHLLLEPGSTIAVMGCEDGKFPYAMAVLNQDFHIIGIDSDRRKISYAKQTWQLDNLEFVVSRLSKPSFTGAVFDAVVDAFTLHEVYSRQGFSETRVSEMLASHFSLLKTGGILFLRDFAHPPPGEYVLMELMDEESRGEEAETLSDVDLLFNFADRARAVNNEQGRGFFLEEVEAINEGTRLFRLNYKWAYEFYLRKDNRAHWVDELAKEYTFMTPREIRKTLRNLGARVLYAAPYHQQKNIRNYKKSYFKLYDDDGTPLGSPPANHIFVARKISTGQSQLLQERRPTNEPLQHLQIQAHRNKLNGRIYEMVSRDTEVVEFIPYRISETGRLRIFLHEGLPRAITNAVPRSGKNIDGKRWSGHMVEAISIDRIIMSEYNEPWDADSTSAFTRHYLGMKSAKNKTIIPGPEFYPNSKIIDERIETRFVEIEERENTLGSDWRYKRPGTLLGRGKIREFDAQQVLNAINVGFIPSSRLESQIFALFQILGLKADNWAEAPLHLQEINVDTVSFKDFVQIFTDKQTPFEPVGGSYNQIRSIHSYFVDEGLEDGANRGISAEDVEFIVGEKETLNTAVIIPLAKNMHGEMLAGFATEYLPAPQRYRGRTKSITAPTLNLPATVKDMDMAEEFIAQQFDVPLENVLRLGESYFMHNGVTPQRIFPFAVSPRAADGTILTGSDTWTNYAPMRWAFALYWHMIDESIASVYKKAVMSMRHDLHLGYESANPDFQTSATPEHFDVGVPIINFGDSNPTGKLENFLSQLENNVSPESAPQEPDVISQQTDQDEISPETGKTGQTGYDNSPEIISSGGGVGGKEESASSSTTSSSGEASTGSGGESSSSGGGQHMAQEQEQKQEKPAKPSGKLTSKVRSLAKSFQNFDGKSKPDQSADKPADVTSGYEQPKTNKQDTQSHKNSRHDYSNNYSNYNFDDGGDSGGGDNTEEDKPEIPQFDRS